MLWRLLVVACLTGSLIGCGGDSSRGVNRDRDRPRSAEKSDAKKADKEDKPEKLDKVDKAKK